ncbi:MAG: alpha-L-fucosidase, partial [Lachnospiraceae bacterium]|nr:alpha-L-fucosidase [Lachnospiraceae bacterium]
WMRVNGSIIIGSRVWRKAKEGPTEDVEGQFADGTAKTYTGEDFRFMVNDGCIYAFCMNYPEDGHIVIRSLKTSKDQNVPEFHGIIRKVSVVGFDEAIKFEQTEEGLCFTTEHVRSEYPVAIRIEVD